ncbi:hypothetical protein CXF35_00690 [Corynebacterium bovis]|uniref:Uncharacterized protein n=1 Tax=Corynebacterium bovis TaxID=36808 RepID=A0A426Q418_9CORY|nr:hypothetical protein [Corynebacterium bovis]RRO92662.1 hypothetical protein CXF40_03015 [Corynebacterium bovis]RRO98645.1 hypothetical protein CXF32_00415 [Corynebacterium bovis]RRO99661.1 hypothetical protein CXF41_08875 [Corynebacterium bovis]RRQ00563.1 hypothetical protein CXF31_00380 [Corynebacterium bovis]RRQ03527.1 hypothetical protein CXF42_06905 [Corynebacterium bovis]
MDATNHPGAGIVAAGPPDKPWTGTPSEVTSFLDLMVSWGMYLGLFIAVCATIILFSMMAIDRNRGEAGIATSEQARWTKWAIGIGVVCAAPKIVTWLVQSFPI